MDCIIERFTWFHVLMSELKLFWVKHLQISGSGYKSGGCSMLPPTGGLEAPTKGKGLLIFTMKMQELIYIAAQYGSLTESKLPLVRKFPSK